VLEDNKVELIDAETLYKWLALEEVNLFDVREEYEFKVARIPQAISLPLSSFNTSTIKKSHGKRIVLHCKSGVRCELAAKLLLSSGFREVIYRLEGGILAWEAYGGQIYKETH
tara:strand:- start:601 stop:939 length:339 start_codon:yes stop_codon:yes gene_type:complete